ncbi:MAG: sugar kinase [Deltaproteobacteria bacterium]|nr:sugar kinase [Deltaproteobacteria bacterium]
MSLTVIGTVALDSVTSPFGSLEKGLGGSATHFSASASYFTPVSLVAVIGEDFPQEHLDFLSARNINLEGVQKLPGKSFHWKGKYEEDLNIAHTLATELNVLLEFQPQLTPEQKKTPFLFLANVDPNLQSQAIDQVEEAPFIAADTMNFWIEGSRQALLNMLKRIHMLVINEGEARLLAKESNLLKASKIIRQMGPEILIIKQGEYGALAFYKEEIFSAPGLPLEDIKDPTGAGDSFAGGLMGYLSKTGKKDFESIKQGIIYGSVMASFNVSQFSCEALKNLSETQIKERYETFRNLARF